MITHVHAVNTARRQIQSKSCFSTLDAITTHATQASVLRFDTGTDQCSNPPTQKAQTGLLCPILLRVLFKSRQCPPESFGVYATINSADSQG